MKLLLIILLTPGFLFCQIENDLTQNNQRLHEEGSNILMMGISINVISFGILLSGPINELGVGILFSSNQTVGITLDVIGAIKLIKAKNKK